jgi:hypothetical protein
MRKWIDCCCIDKTSSAELSEAINSIPDWCRNSQVCYAYLSDVPSLPNVQMLFQGGKWVTRGWALQGMFPNASFASLFLLFRRPKVRRLNFASRERIFVDESSSSMESVLEALKTQNIDRWVAF